jgi:hypothetical protein
MIRTKVIVPKAEGYLETLLESMLRCTLFPSSFFDQPVPVRGVCFAAGPDSSQLARNFAERRLGLAVFSMNHEAGTEMAWIEMSRIFTHPQTTFSRMGILLPNLDRTSVEAQRRVVTVRGVTQKDDAQHRHTVFACGQLGVGAKIISGVPEIGFQMLDVSEV